MIIFQLIDDAIKVINLKESKKKILKYSFKKLYFFLPGFKNERKISQGGLNVEMNNARDKEFFTFSNEISNCKRDCGLFILYWGFNLDRN